MEILRTQRIGKVELYDNCITVFRKRQGKYGKYRRKEIAGDERVGGRIQNRKRIVRKRGGKRAQDGQHNAQRVAIVEMGVLVLNLLTVHHDQSIVICSNNSSSRMSHVKSTL